MEDQKYGYYTVDKKSLLNVFAYRAQGMWCLDESCKMVFLQVGILFLLNIIIGFFVHKTSFSFSFFMWICMTVFFVAWLVLRRIRNQDYYKKLVSKELEYILYNAQVRAEIDLMEMDQ